MALDRIAQDHRFGQWRGKFNGSLAEGFLGREKVWLLKPETFMNRSGEAVLPLARWAGLRPEDLLVVYDPVASFDAPGWLPRDRAVLDAGHAVEHPQRIRGRGAGEEAVRCVGKDVVVDLQHRVEDVV